jgi:hypothetical protein
MNTNVYKKEQTLVFGVCSVALISGEGKVTGTGKKAWAEFF